MAVRKYSTRADWSRSHAWRVSSAASPGPRPRMVMVAMQTTLQRLVARDHKVRAKSKSQLLLSDRQVQALLRQGSHGASLRSTRPIIQRFSDSAAQLLHDRAVHRATAVRQVTG